MLQGERTVPTPGKSMSKHGKAATICFTNEWVWLPGSLIDKIISLVPLQYIGEHVNKAKKNLFKKLVTGQPATKLFSNNLALFSSNYMSTCTVAQCFT